VTKLEIDAAQNLIIRNKDFQKIDLCTSHIEVSKANSKYVFVELLCKTYPQCDVKVTIEQARFFFKSMLESIGNGDTKGPS
jgi:hypothetical protein